VQKAVMRRTGERSMPVNVTRRGFGSRVLDSFVAALIGFLLIPGAFVMFFINEGSVDLSKAAAGAALYDGANASGSLVYTVGDLTADDVLTDKANVLTGKKRLSLTAVAETFVWVETTYTSEDSNGDTRTEYTYNKEWTAYPADSSHFQYNHDDSGETVINPDVDVLKSVLNKYVTVKYSSASVNGLVIAASDVAKLGLRDSNVALNAETVSAAYAANIGNGNVSFSANSGYTDKVYWGYGPELGDVRVTFYEVDGVQTGLVIGSLENGSIKAYTATRKTTFGTRTASLIRYLATESLDEAVSILKTEYKTQLWLFRIIGTILVYIGFLLLLQPLTTLLGFIPFVGRFSRGILAIVFLPLSVAISAAVILLAALVNNIVTFIALMAAIALLFVLLISKKKRAAAEAA